LGLIVGVMMVTGEHYLIDKDVYFPFFVLLRILFVSLFEDGFHQHHHQELVQ